MRLLDWPVGLRWRALTWTSGPNVLGATSSVTSRVQTVESPYGLVGFTLSLELMRGRMARRYRGLVTALHGGANAVRVPWRDADAPSWAELGVSMPAGALRNGLPWENSLPWGNGLNWRVSPPTAVVTQNAAERAHLIVVDVANWGGELLPGTTFGFVGHFGLYTAKEVAMSGSYATVRIWPSLRASLLAGQHATLRPTIAMTLAAADAGQFARTTMIDQAQISLIEVPHDVIIQHREQPDVAAIPPVPSGNWILSSGDWNDGGVWDDTSEWID